MNGLVTQFDEYLSTTRSVRKRIDFERAVDIDILLECVDLAVQAPTGDGAESWRFIVVTEDSKKRGLGDIYRRAFDQYMARREDEIRRGERDAEDLSPNYRFLADHLEDYPALVMVTRGGRPSDEIAQQVAFYGSIMPAAWSLMLAMRARGLGATWTTLHSLYEEDVRILLDMPADSTPVILLPVGYIKNAVLKAAQRAPATHVTYWNKWGTGHS